MLIKSFLPAGVTQLVESLVANEIVAGSSPVSRSAAENRGEEIVIRRRWIVRRGVFPWLNLLFRPAQQPLRGSGGSPRFVR